MAIKIRTNFFPPLDKPKMYLVYIIYDKYVSWEFCVRMISTVFHKSIEDAMAITDNILNEGEGLCGAYVLEIAETKAETIENQAKEENFSVRCLVEEV